MSWRPGAKHTPREPRSDEGQPRRHEDMKVSHEGTKTRKSATKTRGRPRGQPRRHDDTRSATKARRHEVGHEGTKTRGTPTLIRVFNSWPRRLRVLVARLCAFVADLRTF